MGSKVDIVLSQLYIILYRKNIYKYISTPIVGAGLLDLAMGDKRHKCEWRM